MNNKIVFYSTSNGTLNEEDHVIVDGAKRTIASMFMFGGR